MQITFFAAEKDREDMLAAAFQEGARRHGHACNIVRSGGYPAPSRETDVAVMIGVKGYSRLLFDHHLEAGKHVIYIDKGYLGRGSYYRMSVDSFQPLHYFQKTPRPDDRLKRFNIDLAPMRKNGKHVVIAGGSLKYAMWHRMSPLNGEDPMTTWARRNIRRLRRATDRPLIYRPKPSWKDAVHIAGTTFSRSPETIHDVLKGAWALMTFGSNAAVDALIAGIPVIITGDGIAQPLAKQALNSIEEPHVPTDTERWQWLSDVAYCQFTLAEMAAGTAWTILSEQMYGK